MFPIQNVSIEKTNYMNFRQQGLPANVAFELGKLPHPESRLVVYYTSYRRNNPASLAMELARELTDSYRVSRQSWDIEQARIEALTRVEVEEVCN